MTALESARVQKIMDGVRGIPDPDHEHDLNPEHAVFDADGAVLQRGISDEYAAQDAAETWRTTYYRPDAWSGELCNDYRDHPREVCGEHHELG
jgi:hypothetical protein